MTSHREKRLYQLEENLELLYDKLSKFEKKKIISSNTEQKFETEHKIKNEILPELKKIETERAELLIELGDPEKINEIDSKVTIDELYQAVLSFEQTLNQVVPDLVTSNLEEIKSQISDKATSANSKLKIILPLLPPIVYYEIELNTTEIFTNIWRKIQNIFQDTLNQNP